MNPLFSPPSPTAPSSASASIAAPASIDRLRANLAAQTAAAQELESVLAQERERLMAREWEAVLRLSEDKNRLVARLHQQGRELQDLAAGQPLSAVLRTAGLLAEQTALHDQAARLLKANRESRALLDHHQMRVGTALRLMNRGNPAGTYGRNGYAGIGRLSQKLAAA